MSIMRGTKASPKSLCKRSASACLRTEPNTRNPFEIRTFVVPQPIPVETPVTTTSLLFAIAFLPEQSLFIFYSSQYSSQYQFSLVGYVVLREHIHLLISEPRLEGDAEGLAGWLECQNPHPSQTEECGTRKR